MVCGPRIQKEEGRRKKEEERRKKKEGRRKKLVRVTLF